MTDVSPSYRFGVLTLSDKGSRGERIDTSGPLLQDMLQGAGFTLVCYQVMADEEELIIKTLRQWADEFALDLIITTGGTGVSPRDRTPEATRKVIEREVPGLAEAMRLASLQLTPQAVWSRGVAGIYQHTLVINLPGSAKAAQENLLAILPALSHGLEKIHGSDRDCAQLSGQ